MGKKAGGPAAAACRKRRRQPTEHAGVAESHDELMTGGGERLRCGTTDGTPKAFRRGCRTAEFRVPCTYLRLPSHSDKFEAVLNVSCTYLLTV